MKTCPHCHIQVGGSAQYCPLCQNPLVGTPEPTATPRWCRRAADIAVLPHRCLCAAGGGGHLRRGGLHHDRRQAYALEPAGADRRGGVLLLLRALLRQGRNAPKLLFQILIGTSLIVTFADYYAGGTALPLTPLCDLVQRYLVLNFIFAFVNRRFTENGLVYLLLNIVVGVVPYIGLTLRHSVRPPMAWVICLVISMITFLGLVIFKAAACWQSLKNACTCKSELVGRSPPSCYRKTVLSLESPTGAFIASLRFANANLKE